MTKIHIMPFGCSVWNASSLVSWQNQDLKLVENICHDRNCDSVLESAALPGTAFLSKNY